VNCESVECQFDTSNEADGVVAIITRSQSKAKHVTNNDEHSTSAIDSNTLLNKSACDDDMNVVPSSLMLMTYCLSNVI